MFRKHNHYSAINIYGVCLLLLIAACNGNKADKSAATSKQNDSYILQKKDTVHSIKDTVHLGSKANMTTSRYDDRFDTTFTLFSDTSYHLAIHIGSMDEEYAYDESKKNATLVFYKNLPGKQQVLRHDSLHCFYIQPIIFEDYNFDGVKDILVFHETGARANEMYYLYLVDTGKKQLIPIKGFEDIPNTSVDSENHCIMSLALAGQDYVSFYYISSHHKLVDVGVEYIDDHSGGSKQYNNAMKKLKAKMKDLQTNNK